MIDLEGLGRPPSVSFRSIAFASQCKSIVASATQGCSASGAGSCPWRRTARQIIMRSKRSCPARLCSNSPPASSTESFPGSNSIGVFSRRLRTAITRCWSSFGSSRSRPTTSTSSSWSGSRAFTGRSDRGSRHYRRTGFRRPSRWSGSATRPRRSSTINRSAIARSESSSRKPRSSSWSRPISRSPNAIGFRTISCSISSRS